MCGILLFLDKDAVDQCIKERLIANVSKRGPCHQSSATKINSVTTAFSSVLHLRGSGSYTKQPIQDSCGNYLLFNGEIFAHETPVPIMKNDSLHLSELLNGAANAEEVAAVLSKIKGPFAFAFYHKQLDVLFFGRDVLGRRSLLWDFSANNLTISSVGATLEMQEIPANGIYCLDVSKGVTKECISLFPWHNSTIASEFKLISHFELISPFAKLNRTIPINTFGGGEARDIERYNDMFYKVLYGSCKRRVENIPSNQGDARLAFLFSGGLDCMVIASIIETLLDADETVDLLNVAFENPRSNPSKNTNVPKAKRKKNRGIDCRNITAETICNTEEPGGPVCNTQVRGVYDVPDRLTAIQGYNELKERYPRRKFRLIQIDVPYNEMCEHRCRIMELCHPSNTVMDFSIGVALWFASRGMGTEFESGQKCTSKAKVLFSGLGADEQLGGYGRHKVRYQQGGWESLLDELQLDVDRISTRNLGRDDRIISDHGKEVRFPYLDEEVIAFLSSVPIDYKIQPTLEKGVGDKILLRRLAMDKRVGPLALTSREAKRAIQFGARTAKMESKKEEGR